MNEELYNARCRKGWSQEEAAAAVGADRTTYWEWENTERLPQPYYLDRLRKAFGMTAEELGYGNYGQIRLSRRRVARSGTAQSAQASTQSGEDMDKKRRLLLQSAAGFIVGSKAVGSAEVEPTKGIDETILDHFERTIRLCWDLLRVDGLPMMEQLLPTFVPSLESLAQQPSGYQKIFAGLASQGCLLAGLVAVLQMNISAAESYCKKAVLYSRVAEDRNLEVAALKHLATKYSDAKYPLKTLRAYQEALPLVDRVSPLLRSRTYLGLALAYAQCGQRQESLYPLGLAKDTFPEYPQDDPAFPYADCGPSSLNHYGGLIHLEFDEPRKAWETFAGAETLTIVVPKRTIIEINNCQAEAAIADRNLELACHHVHVGVAGAHELKSEKRFEDAFGIYRQMRLVWPHESQVKALADLFHR